MTCCVKHATRGLGRASEIILTVGLIGALVWSIHGKSCYNKEECKPDISCHTVRWSCNGSTDLTTAAPTQDPLNSKCCIHLDTCGGEVEVAGWINVRNTSVELDGVPHSAEWLDTFITEGNATQPALIKSTYVGSWSTLKQADTKFPSQMFVAEPTNSCTVDGDPKWPEWYQVTINVINGDGYDQTLDVEGKSDKDCLCDAEWDCLDNTCWVATQNTSESGAGLSQTDPALEDKIAKWCRSSEKLIIVNHTASSYFSLGFGPSQSAINSFNFSSSVEGGWGPDLEDTAMWLQMELDQDSIISGIMTQGVAVNPERRVDEFMVEYEALDTPAQLVNDSKVFKAGARLDTKMINSFYTPIIANRVRLLISKPCDPYFVGLRVAPVGCQVCDSSIDCNEFADGFCEPERFCSYAESTTLMPTTLGPTTGPIITTQGQLEPRTSGPTPTGAVPSDMPTPVTPTSPEVTTPADTTPLVGLTTAGKGATSPTVGQTAADQATTAADSPTNSAQGQVTTTAAAGLGDVTTAPQPAQTTAADQSTRAPTASLIADKIAEVTQGLPPGEKKVVEDLLNSDKLVDPKMYPKENVTLKVIKAGLEVIRNITTEANATQNAPLQVDIVKAAWNFLAVVSTTDSFVQEGVVDSSLLEEYLDVSSLILHKDRKDAWKEVQEESIAGPLGIAKAVEDVAVQVAAQAPRNLYIVVNKTNIEGLLLGKRKEEFMNEDYGHTFPGDHVTEVNIFKEDFQNDIYVNSLPANSSLVVVVLRFSSIADVLDDDDVQDKTPLGGKTKRLGSDVLSVSVVGNTTHSMPVSFRIGHSPVQTGEDQRCEFWKPNSQEWSHEGCETSNTKSTSTKCACNHMTNYAVLMWLGEEAPRVDGSLDTISKVGLLMSIAALALAMGLLLFLRSSLSSERIIIHMHLMSVTLVALILFLAAVDKTENPLACQFITIALHFFYMSMFSWMLVEGIHLYRQIIAVFESEKSRLWIYFAIGWGIPIVVVGITSGIFFDKYKNHNLCWLEMADGSIWALLGPMIPIILVNFVVLFMVSRIVMSAAKLQQEKPSFNSVKAGLRSSLLLLPILGITWVFGFFSHMHPALEYIFVTLNSFQGFFMALFHCFMSSEVNGALKQKIRKVKESSLGGASTVDSTHKPAMFTSGIRKVKVSPSTTENTDDY